MAAPVAGDNRAAAGPVDNALSAVRVRAYRGRMTAQHSPMPEPLGLLTLSDWAALPEHELVHTELQEGVLRVSPRPRQEHQNAQFEMLAALRAACPPGIQGFGEIDVVVEARGPATVRVPDIAVIRTGGPQPVAASDVILVVEIVSPGSAGTDRVMKRYEYARAGIPHYWILEPDRSLTVLRLGDDGEYTESCPPVTGVFRTADPFPVEIDLPGM